MSSAIPSAAHLHHLADEARDREATLTLDDSPYDGSPETLLTRITTAVDAVSDDISGIVSSLHSHPEVAYEEYRSAATITDVLSKHGIEVEVGVHGVTTAFRAEASGAPGPTIAILAEYDALPGLGHACGHNVIAAAAVGGFLALNRLLANDSQAFSGRVVLLGTPAEEGHSGKEVMARAKAFDDIDVAIMVHPYGQDVADQVWLGRRLLTVTFLGVSAHASAQPFMGRNALDAANLAYQGIGLLRQQLPPTDRVHANIVEGGTRPSIIPERAVMKIYARSKYADTLRDLGRRLTEVANGAALMAGVDVDIEWDEHPASLPVRTNHALNRHWVRSQHRQARRPLAPGVVSETLAASTDFGNVSHLIPGIHPLIGIADPETALHTEEFAEAAGSSRAFDAAIDAAVGLASTALDWLCDEKLRIAVSDEFARAGGPLSVEGYFG